MLWGEVEGGMGEDGVGVGVKRVGEGEMVVECLPRWHGDKQWGHRQVSRRSAAGRQQVSGRSAAA